MESNDLLFSAPEASSGFQGGIIASGYEMPIKQDQAPAGNEAQVLGIIRPFMRELRSVKALVEKMIRRADAARIQQIHLALGELSEPDRDALQNHWGELTKGTPLEHARLRIRLIHAEAQCMACFKKYRPADGSIHCPHCGSFGAKILCGEEFHVEFIETDGK